MKFSSLLKFLASEKGGGIIEIGNVLVVMNLLFASYLCRDENELSEELARVWAKSGPPRYVRAHYKKSITLRDEFSGDVEELVEYLVSVNRLKRVLRHISKELYEECGFHAIDLEVANRQELGRYLAKVIFYVLTTEYNKSEDQGDVSLVLTFYSSLKFLLLDYFEKM